MTREPTWQLVTFNKRFAFPYSGTAHPPGHFPRDQRRTVHGCRRVPTRIHIRHLGGEYEHRESIGIRSRRPVTFRFDGDVADDILVQMPPRAITPFDRSKAMKDETTTSGRNAPDKSIGAAQMAEYGITRVPVDYFHIGSFRYTVLADAIAEAKRRLAKN